MKTTKVRQPHRSFAACLVLTLLAGFSSIANAEVPGVCGPLDVVFVVDDTGSMSGAISNIQSGISDIANKVVVASGGDYQMGLVSFKDSVETDVDLAPGNAAAIQAGVAALTGIGGGKTPEASDAALDTVINGNSDFSDGGPCNAPFNSAGLRPGATKIAILLTDQLPGGCSDSLEPGDIANAGRVAGDASAKNILISAIYNSDMPSALTAGIMTNYAAETGGIYLNTPSNGDGTTAAIDEILQACGSSAANCPLSQGFWKNHLLDWPPIALGGFEIGGVFYTPWQILTIFNAAPKRGNSYLILAHQFIAAKLNIANGSDPEPVNGALFLAENALSGVNLLTDYTKNSALNEIADFIEDYNTRDLTPDCLETENED